MAIKMKKKIINKYILLIGAYTEIKQRRKQKF
jgi:hypothetical protein